MNNLFAGAFQALSNHEQECYQSWENAALAVTYSSTGQQVVENLRRESHLLDPMSSPKEIHFAEFLREIGKKYNHLGNPETAYNDSSKLFDLKGEPVKWDSGDLLRFIPLTPLAQIIAKESNEE